MHMITYYIENPLIEQIVKEVERFQQNMQYPNSKTVPDLVRNTMRFEKQMNLLLNQVKEEA